ncbi:MAG: ABC transporter substrate-binding protein [Oscillospiraceae bacterium]
MKRMITLLAALALIITAFSGCAQSSNESGKVRLVLDWAPNTNHTGFYVAQAKGYYEEVGLEVEIQQPPESGAVTLLAAGNAEYAITFQEEMGPAIAKNDPLPIHAVAAIINHNTSGIVSLKESGITSPKDLMGKRLSAWESPLVSGIVGTIVENDGGDFSQVEVVSSTVTDVVSALQADIDAVWIYYAWDGIATQVAGLDTNYFSFGEADGLFDFYTPVLAVNDSYAERSPEEVDKFMAATAKGFQYAMENPEEAAAILVEQVPELDGEMVLASQIWLADQYQSDAPYWGYIDEARWKNFYDWMYEQKLLENPLGEKGFTNQHLPGAKG